MLYINGEAVNTPSITDKEYELLTLIKNEYFGDMDVYDDLITVANPNDGDDYYDGGLEIVEQIKWDGSRKSLGGVLSSLEKKGIIQTEEFDKNKTGIWFDLEAVKQITAAHEQ